jgi:hypothetical protein
MELADRATRLRGAYLIVQQVSPVCAEKDAVLRTLGELIAVLERPDLRDCKRCGRAFEWCEGEQQFYAERQFAPPLFCRTCRQARRVEREARDGGRD